jgi:hypothetical protein
MISFMAVTQTAAGLSGEAKQKDSPLDEEG